MGPDEHRREAEMLQRERTDDPEAKNSAIEHEQIAKFMEMAKSQNTFGGCYFSRGDVCPPVNLIEARERAR